MRLKKQLINEFGLGTYVLHPGYLNLEYGTV